MRNKSSHYTTRKIKKRKGGFRELYIPDNNLRVLQQRVLTRILSKASIPKYCWAFEPGRSVPEMAKEHVGKKEVLSLDISNFFPTCTQLMIQDMLEKEGLAYGAASRTIAEICTYKWFLPQGAVTSPKISNLIVKNTFGPVLDNIAVQTRLNMTIYADDITFSSRESSVILGRRKDDLPGVDGSMVDPISRDLENSAIWPFLPRDAPKEYFTKAFPNTVPNTDLAYQGSYKVFLTQEGKNLLPPNTPRKAFPDSIIYHSVDGLVDFCAKAIAKSGFSLNPSKTKFMKSSHRQFVCGAVVNDKVSLPRKQRLKLRAIVHNISKNGVAAEAAKFSEEGNVPLFLQTVRGRINWFKQLNPEAGGALLQKFEEAVAPPGQITPENVNN